MFWYAGQLTRNLGVSTVLVLTLFSYTIRFFIYSAMSSPLHGLPAEALRGATFALFWSTATIYAHKIAPEGMSATLLAIMNGMYGGLGQSVGAIVGGRLQGSVGTRRMLRHVGTVDGVFVVCMAGWFWWRGEKGGKVGEGRGDEVIKEGEREEGGKGGVI